MRKIIEGLVLILLYVDHSGEKKKHLVTLIFFFIPKKNTIPEFLPFLIDFLIKKNSLQSHLTIGGETKYMGICKLTKKGIPRRIDIRYIKKEHVAPVFYILQVQDYLTEI